MSIFEPVTISWKGEDYTVPADKVMRMIACIEDHVKVGDLIRPEGPGFVKLSMAYGSALRYAGARVADDEIYESIYAQGADQFATLVASLLTMMMPPSTLKTVDDGKKKTKSGK